MAVVLLAGAVTPATAERVPGAGGGAGDGAGRDVVRDAVGYVDPLIGSTGGGNTYPGAVRPFGMISWSPTTTRGDQTDTGAANGYAYDATRVRGFGLTHVNGAGCHPGAAGDVPIMPFVGEVTGSPTADVRDEVYAADFRHEDETATPGRYRVGLASGASADLSVTTRAGVGDFAFPRDRPAALLFRVSNSLNGSEDAEVVIDPDRRTVSGSVLTGAFCGRRANGGANNKKTYYRLHFTASFDRAFSGTGTWVDGDLRPGTTTASGGEGYETGAARQGRGSGGYVTFDTSSDTDVRVRVGISYTSADAARRNLDHEIGARETVDSVAADARREWARQLRAVEVGGGTDELRTTFYTALYHAFLQPNVTSDVDGAYLGGDRRVHRLERGQRAQYGNFSGWDQYRAQTQLLALLEPRVASDYAQSLLNLARHNGGVWDRWVHVNGPTHVMTGDPSAPALAGVHAMGARDFDVRGAFESLVRQATVPHPDGLSDRGCPGQCEGQRPNLAEYLRLGYAPQDTCHCWGGAAETLEDAAADFALADWAARLGRTDVRDALLPRASWWRNTFNPAAGDTGYQQARNSDGTWTWPFSPSSDLGFAQGTSATYTWMVPHDVSGLAAAMGGREQAVRRLDAFFRDPDGSWATGGDPLRYDPTNEPGIHTPWLYNGLGQPWKTQETVRAMASLVYRTGPAGLPGNDDLGTMSAWYVFAALGLYPQTPSRAELLISSPVFPFARLGRPGGAGITIKSPNASPTNVYIRSVEVDRRSHPASWLSERFVTRGGELVVDVGDTPNTSWGKDDLPVDHVRPASGPVPNLPAACTASGSWCAQDLGGQYDVDGAATADAEQQGDLDGKGWSFPAEQLPAPGTRSVDDVAATVPDTTGTARNFLTARGQRLHLTPGRYRSLELLATAVNGDQRLTLTTSYADGGVTETALSITDWAAPAARHGERPAVTATTRYRTDGTADGRTARIWRLTVPLDASREATSLVLSANANAKVFALSTGMP
ncbi:GH92 family glycosyl hydrolase [Saccharothrix lopnurensis]|uniref:GH92 family glycosyl hydrolase n=1 Tax=Saccharothrix lopnurensis TaxID=1670621 RepID=A0ABW1P5Y5_9PSEU